MMRGQATSTQHRLSEIFSLACRAGSHDPALRSGAKRLATGLSPTNQWSTTTMPQGKLPSYLQSLHHIRPARPSMGSSGLGSDILSNLSVKQNTWKLPDISSLHNVCRTRISQSRCKTFISSEDKFRCNHPYRPKAVGHRWPTRPERSARGATASGQNMVELSGIEPLTPCLQSRCSPS